MCICYNMECSFQLIFVQNSKCNFFSKWRVPMQNANFKMQKKIKLQNLRCRMQCQIQNTRCKIQNAKCSKWNVLCSYYLCNGSRASPGGKSGGLLALLFAIIWALNLIADNIDTKKPVLEKQSVSVLKPSLADQRKPVFENSPSGADLSLEKALAGNEPFREFQGRSL